MTQLLTFRPAVKSAADRATEIATMSVAVLLRFAAISFDTSSTFDTFPRLTLADCQAFYHAVTKHLRGKPCRRGKIASLAGQLAGCHRSRPARRYYPARAAAAATAAVAIATAAMIRCHRLASCFRLSPSHHSKIASPVLYSTPTILLPPPLPRALQLLRPSLLIPGIALHLLVVVSAVTHYFTRFTLSDHDCNLLIGRKLLYSICTCTV